MFKLISQDIFEDARDIGKCEAFTILSFWANNHILVSDIMQRILRLLGGSLPDGL